MIAIDHVSSGTSNITSADRPLPATAALASTTRGGAAASGGTASSPHPAATANARARPATPPGRTPRRYHGVAFLLSWLAMGDAAHLLEIRDLVTEFAPSTA